MQSVLGHLRLLAAVLVFCFLVLPSVDLPGPMSIGAGVAWADDDGDDDDDDDDDDDQAGGGSTSGGTSSGGSTGGGTSSGGSTGGGSSSSGSSNSESSRSRSSNSYSRSNESRSSGWTNSRSTGSGSAGGGSAGGGFVSGEGSGPFVGDADRWSPSAKTSDLAMSTYSTASGAGSTLDLSRRLKTESTQRPDDSTEALSSDARLVSSRAGAWNRPIRLHAVRGEMLVLDAEPAEIEELEKAGFRLLDQTRLDALGLVASRFGLPAGRDIRSALRRARSRAPGATMAANYIYQSAGHEALNECGDAGCYGPTMVGWEQVADTCGTGIRIGMTDTGIDRAHPALRERTVRTNIFDPYGDGSVPDHGTAVAGLLVGNAETGFPGMLPGAELFAADVFHTNEAGDTYSTLLSLVQGLDWLVGNGVSVVNVSMTGPPNALLEDTVNRMNQRGVVVVAAAGNGGPSAQPAYPAAYADVISVTAVDRDLRPYNMANRGAYISFSSPGVGIWSAGASGSGRHRTGTSFAAAHASAIIADMVREDGPTGVHEALRALQDTARDLGAPGRDPVFGWGLIQGNSACRA